MELTVKALRQPPDIPKMVVLLRPPRVTCIDTGWSVPARLPVVDVIASNFSSVVIGVLPSQGHLSCINIRKKRCQDDV
jgi:hypothetical protein